MRHFSSTRLSLNVFGVDLGCRWTGVVDVKFVYDALQWTRYSHLRLIELLISRNNDKPLSDCFELAFCPIHRRFHLNFIEKVKVPVKTKDFCDAVKLSLQNDLNWLQNRQKITFRYPNSQKRKIHLFLCLFFPSFHPLCKTGKGKTISNLLSFSTLKSHHIFLVYKLLIHFVEDFKAVNRITKSKLSAFAPS